MLKVTGNQYFGPEIYIFNSFNRKRPAIDIEKPSLLRGGLILNIDF